MCLGVPGRILAIDGQIAQVEFWGVRREVRLDVVDEPVAEGDWVLNHVGFAIRRIPPEEVDATLGLYEAILAASEQDAMREDVREELAATPLGAKRWPTRPR